MAAHRLRGRSATLIEHSHQSWQRHTAVLRWRAEQTAVVFPSLRRTPFDPPSLHSIEGPEAQRAKLFCPALTQFHGWPCRLYARRRADAWWKHAPSDSVAEIDSRNHGGRHAERVVDASCILPDTCRPQPSIVAQCWATWLWVEQHPLGSASERVEACNTGCLRVHGPWHRESTEFPTSKAEASHRLLSLSLTRYAQWPALNLTYRF